MFRLLLVLASGAALASCAAIPGAPKAPETIRYATGPCFGTCPVYVVTVSSDGVAAYDGRNHVQVEGRRTFVVSDAEFEAFKAALAPYRPEGIRKLDHSTCTNMATDLPTIEVAWNDGKRRDILSVNLGCDMETNRPMFQALQAAPLQLPLDIYVGRR